MSQYDKIAQELMIAINNAIRRGGRTIVAEDHEGLVTVDGEHRIENFRWVDFIKIPGKGDRTAIPDLTEKELEYFKLAVSKIDDEQLQANNLSLKCKINECYGYINEETDQTTRSRNARYYALRTIVKEEIERRKTKNEQT